MSERTYNFGDLFEILADAVPDRVALVAAGPGDEREQRTYAELDERATRLAHHLRESGIRPGDWIGIYSWNRAEWVEAWLACYKVRATPINVNYRYVDAELTYLFDNADLRGLVFERGFAEHVAHVAPGLPKLDVFVALDDDSDATPAQVDALVALGAVPYEEALSASGGERDFAPRSDDDLYVLYTGGTTGMPKGVKWRCEDIYKGAMLGTRGNVEPASPEDLADVVDRGPMTMMGLAPLMHGASQWVMWNAFGAGATFVRWTGHHFDPDAIWRIVQQEKVVSLSIVGDAMGRPLVEGYAANPDAYDLSGLFSIGNGGAMLSQAVKDQINTHIPNVAVMDGFGASETGWNGAGTGGKGQFTRGPGTTVLDDDLREVVPGSGVHGMLARSGRIPLGYHKDETKTAATFVTDAEGRRWVIPGDHATIEADGTITVFGRGSQVVNTGGEKVFPEEVEGALKSHEGVFDAVVVGVPDERFGERVVALVSFREGDVDHDLGHIEAHCRTVIAGYKVPKQIFVLDALQRTPAGKPDYRWAKERALELCE
ncbi:MAG: acyl-CoA synthetase [Acidimicrobiia bacterium]